MCLARDTQGRVLVGTEDNGVWRLNPKSGSWSQFTTKNGLISDRVYALATDKQNRVWVGTQSGVSVICPVSASRDKTVSFGVLNGLGGERVWDIAINPRNGEVWIATNAGISIYSTQKNTWATLTTENGLPSNDVCNLAFASDGTAFIGTQTQGVAVASPQNGYKTWRKIAFETTLPPVGDWVSDKLPTGQINDILIARNGDVVVATTVGLASSADKGKTWNWKRGANWNAKVREQLGGAPAGWKDSGAASLREDYVTSLTQERNGNLLVGFRQQGFARYDANWKEVVDATSSTRAENREYVRAILPLSEGASLVAYYGGGLTQSAPSSFRFAIPKTAPTLPAALPLAATVPDLSQLNALLVRLSRVRVLDVAQQAPITVLPDDWRTGGTQLGRYGALWMNLCAMSPPQVGGNYIWGAGEPIEQNMRIGANTTPDDSLRYWVSSLYTTEPRSLEIPRIFLHSRVLRGLTTWDKNRRQAEVDDHGEEYSMNRDGPHIYSTLKIPRGTFVLSMYDFNKDGRGWHNRFRDYSVSIRAHRDELNITQIKNFAKNPELARGRIRDFWGGVWKRFLVHGPQDITIELGRNYSFNTILAAITLDTLDDEPAPYFKTWDEQRVLDAKRETMRATLQRESAAQHLKRFAPATTAEKAADRLWLELQRARWTNASWWASESRRYYAPLARWYGAQYQSATPKNRNSVLAKLGSCYHALQIFEAWETTQQMRGLSTARQTELALRWNGINNDERGQGLKFITEFLALKNDLGLLASDPKNLEAAQELKRLKNLQETIENLRFLPPDASMVDKNSVLKEGVKLKERTPEEFASLKAKAEKYQLSGF